MSLEQAIAENTAALRDLIAAITSGVSAGLNPVVDEPVQQTKVEKPAKVEKVKAADPKPEPVEEQAPAATHEQKDEPVAAAAEDGEKVITLQDVTDITIALGKAGKRQQLIELLANYDVPKASQISAHLWAEYHSKATALLEG